MRMNRIELPPRLAAVAEYIPAGVCVTDIGTDHGYLPIFVIQTGRCPRAVAADVRPGPLSSARNHIREAGLEERIVVRLSDGLEGFGPEELECVVMAGMGGRLIARLLQKGFEQGKLSSCTALVLQPQSELDRVRKMVHRVGFSISREQMREEKEKRYTVLLAEPGQERYEPQEYIFGRKLFQARDPVFQKMLVEETQKLRTISIQLTAISDPSERVKKRLEEVEELLYLGERMLREWDAP